MKQTVLALRTSRTSTVVKIALCCLMGNAALALADNAPLATVEVQASHAGAAVDMLNFDGVVEAVRQSTVAAQVAGAIVSLNVKAGDSVKAGQDLVRIDARAASQNAAASSAQVDAARASLNLALKEYERQRQLFQKQYISQSALDRTQAQLQLAQSQVQALQAQADVATTQTHYFVVKAPYTGIVSEVMTALGDMATPGRPLLTLYDASALRVSASVSETAMPVPALFGKIQFELPGLSSAKGLLLPSGVTVLPQVDATTHTAQIRLGIPPTLKGATPGMFARVWLPSSATGQGSAVRERLYAPTQSVVRRAEMTGLYVLDLQGRPVLRQVRLGAPQGDRIEVLSGVRKGEKIVLDPQAAAKAR